MPAPGRSPVLELGGVAKAWPRRGAVLSGVDLLVEPAQLVWVGGDNGAGKTTLLRLITGILEPTAGVVRVCGLDATRDRLRYQRKIGSITAGNSGLYARLTVAQHLNYWCRVAFVPGHLRRAWVADAIDQFDLSRLLTHRVDRISMGQRQRVRVAMAFLPRPELLLLDEPKTSLDAGGTRCLGVALDRLRQRGGAAVVCSPEPEEYGVGIDRSLLLTDGRLVAA